MINAYKIILRVLGKDMRSRKCRILIIIAAITMLVITVPYTYRSYRDDNQSVESLVNKLDSSDRGDVFNGYHHLTKRANPAGVNKAIKHLNSDDEYIWLNATLYLGACGEEISVPYLIKALRHPAWRAREEIVEYLKKITGEDFEYDYNRWKSWWDTQNSSVDIDWVSNLGS